MNGGENLGSQRHAAFGPYLDEGESILWAGAPIEPDAAAWLRNLPSFGTLLGYAAALSVSAVLAVKGLEFFRRSEGFMDPLLAVGIALLVASVFPVYVAVAIIVFDRRRASAQRAELYVVTDKRALWAIPNKDGLYVRSIPIQPGDWIGAGLGPKGKVMFSRSIIATNEEGDADAEEDVVEFRDIPDADEVYRLIRRIQLGTT